MISNNAGKNLQLAMALDKLEPHDHVCLICGNEERFDVFVPFIKTGLERGEKSVYLAEEGNATSFLTALSQEGSDVEEALASGKLSISNKSDAYLKGGVFDPDLVISSLKQNIADAKARGFNALRIAVEMTKQPDKSFSMKRLIDYESAINLFFAENDVLAVCHYNLDLLGPEVLLNAIRTHPIVIHKNRICRNMYYVPPGEFSEAFDRRSHMELERSLDNLLAREHAARAEEALGEEKEITDAILESLPGIFYLFDEHGRILRWNKNAERISGYSAEEISRKHPLDFFTDKHKVAIQKKLQEVLETGQTTAEAETVTKDGRKVPFIFFGRAIRIKDSRCIIGVGFDMTKIKRERDIIIKLNEDLKRHARELEGAYKDMESFSYAVSHDLKAPVIRIEGFSSILLEDYRDKLGDSGDLLERIRDNAVHMKQLIEDLLSFFRFGEKKIEKSQIKMSELATAVYEELKRGAGARNIQFKVKALPAAYGDLAMLRQVVLNLLSNALKFTRKRASAEIEVGGYTEDNETIYYVKDNGIGFDMQFKDKLFGLFQRIHLSKEYEGTGMGLVIVKKIVEKHGGRVWAEGMPDRGSVFYFSLPTETESS